MPQGHRDEKRERIDDAARTFDRLLAEQDKAEKEMTEAKRKWADASSALLEQYFVLKELMEDTTP